MNMAEIDPSSIRQRHSRLRNEGEHTRTSNTGDTDVYYPSDDNHGFFAKGRDFESAFVNHRYTAEERKILSAYDSLDYLPSHSVVYKTWLKTQPSRLDWDRWIMMGLIGFSVGFIGFLLHQLIDVIADFKWNKASEYIEHDEVLVAWAFVMGYSCVFVIVGSALVVFLCPSAGGSGIPEVIGFLNGTIVRYIFNVKTMFVKFFSCCCAVGSGMPVGPEGPMIHMGSLVGAGLSQFKSDTIGFKLPFFERFRNSEDRRNFISAGAAAGVASAFGAPVGGLLFSMEEVSSFWNMRLSWQIFFCAMISTFTTDLFNSAFTGFIYQGQFGMFKADKYILFQVDSEIAVNILAFIPAVILGVIGGFLGALFTFINLKIARGRKKLLVKVGNKRLQQAIRLTEPVLLMIVVSTVSVFLPQVFRCSPYSCMPSTAEGEVSHNCVNDTTNPLHTETDVEQYTCPEGEFYVNGTTTWTNGTFNQMATLLFVTGEEAVRHLFSRNTHVQFTYAALFMCLLYYFTVACWAAGTSISSGLVVPMLFIGGLYGRIVGYFMVDMFGVHVGADSYWSWMDPGAFALVGAASFFGGVSRLTMSLTVIMMEITNDVQFLLPIMATIMVAKWVGDFITHPLYHALLELKCIPFLDSEPIIMNEQKKMVNLELFKASDAMVHNPKVVRVQESVYHVATLLRSCSHGGFPVVKQDICGSKIFVGFINRMELIVLLKREELFKKLTELEDTTETSQVKYDDINIDKVSNPDVIAEILRIYAEEPKYQDLYVDLEPYINQSAVTLQGKFSLHRTYIIFRTLGMRHLTVVNENNQVIGIISRKDLMGFSLEERLAERMNGGCAQPRDVELLENHNYPT